MSCSLIQRKRLPSHTSPAGSKLHQASCGTRMAASLSELAKFNQDCSALSTRQQGGGLPRMASIFEEPGFVTPHTPQHKFGAQREYCSAREWQTQLAAIGIDPASLASQSFRPWEAAPHPCENTRSASPVFPQLGLEPNHVGLASQSLFLLEEFLQSKTQWHSKTFSSSKNDLKEFRAHSNVFQNKTSSTQTQNNLPNSSQNNMFLRHGSNNIQNTKNPQKNEKSTSKLFHAQTGSIWFQIGSSVVPTWFLRFSIVQMVVPTNLKVTYLFSCTCNVPR